MRTITDHKTNACNEQLNVLAVDAAGAGGAHHHYEVSGFDATENPSRPEHQSAGYSTIVFQNGPIKECGVNGVTQEALLAILIDRMRCFNAGPYRCRENACALTHLEEALHWLHSRTRSREQQGVEGTMAKREGGVEGGV